MRKKRFRNKEEGPAFSNISIFVTPMLDMSFQLLAFFVFTYSPAALEGQFPITLAQGEAGGSVQQAKPEDKAAIEEPTQTKPTLFIEARNKEKGRLGSIRIRNGPERIEITVEPTKNDDALLEALTEELVKKLKVIKARNPGEDRITIEASPVLKWRDVMWIIDACRRYNEEGKELELFPKVNLGSLSD